MKSCKQQKRQPQAPPTSPLGRTDTHRFGAGKAELLVPSLLQELGQVLRHEAAEVGHQRVGLDVSIVLSQPEPHLSEK